MGKSGQRSQLDNATRLDNVASRRKALLHRVGFRRKKTSSRAFLGSASAKKRKLLAYEENYRCPACASGDLSAIALMDVFACDFCRHIFSVNLKAQSVYLADSLQTMAWYWDGWHWKTAQQNDTAASLVWAFTIGLTIAPVGIIALSNYVFPPLDSSGFPKAWTVLTLICHSLIALWLLAEYHRWPWYVSSGIRLNRLRARWSASEA